MVRKTALPIALSVNLKVFGSKQKVRLAKILLVDQGGRVLREISIASDLYVSNESVSSMLVGMNMAIRSEFDIPGFRIRIVPGEGLSAVIIGEGGIPEAEAAVVRW